jgi:hypothetical protein
MLENLCYNLASQNLNFCCQLQLYPWYKGDIPQGLPYELLVYYLFLSKYLPDLPTSYHN